MESIKVEDYLKSIYQICANRNTETAATGEVAEQLRVTPGSVTTMLQRLADSGLVAYQSHRGAKLTDAGEKLALNVLRRHRLVEAFLAKTLGMTWDQLHAEAERLEHAISEELIDRIDQHLGFPDKDPHGDPIPNADGSLRSLPGDPLVGLASGTSFTLERVLDQTPEFLRYMTEGGLTPGAIAVVIQNLPTVGILVIETGGRQISLGLDAARKLLVKVAAK